MRDLADLRSAVKFWLEEYGFEVLTSESSDFPHPIDRDALSASLVPLEDSDYYLLLLGFRYGTRTPEGISVTQAEFRRARQLARESGRPRMLHLVRREVWTIRSASGAPGRGRSDDWQAVKAFLADVERAEEPHDANWINTFETFRDVVDVLRATLRITGPLLRRALEANLAWELRANAARLLRKNEAGGIGPSASILARGGDLPDGTGPITERVTISPNGASRLAWFRMHWPGSGTLSRAALREAILSGLFLDYDAVDGRPVVGPTQRVLLDLEQRLARLDTMMGEVVGLAPMSEDLGRIFRAGRRDSGGSTTIGGDTLRWLYALRDELDNVLLIIRGLHRFLVGETEAIEVGTLYPIVPDAQMAAEIEGERISELEAERWLRDSRWPMPETGPR